MTRDFQQCGILTSVDSDEPVQPPFQLRTLKWCSVSSQALIEYSIDQQRLWSDCAYAQAGLSLCWSHIPHCWKSHDAAHMCWLNDWYHSTDQRFTLHQKMKKKILLKCIEKYRVLRTYWTLLLHTVDLVFQCSYWRTGILKSLSMTVEWKCEGFVTVILIQNGMSKASLSAFEVSYACSPFRRLSSWKPVNRSRDNQWPISYIGHWNNVTKHSNKILI